MPHPDTTWANHVTAAANARPDHYVKSRYPGVAKQAQNAFTPAQWSAERLKRLDYSPPPQTSTSRVTGGVAYPALRGHKFLIRPFEATKHSPLATQLRGNGGEPGSDEEYYAQLSDQIETGRQIRSKARSEVADAGARSQAAPTWFARPLWNRSEHEPGLWPHQNSWGMQRPFLPGH